MPPRRLASSFEPIRLRVDGKDVPARAGEPVAVALAASGRLVFARSVKYHRPRGPACFAARCDGCLMRVDGIANVMTCRAPARDGMIVETQNVVGFAKRDLLAATDWFFPDGMNHHEMFTQFGPLNKAMQKVARRIAGIGALPSRTVEQAAPRDTTCDVAVVGAGPAGLVAARELAKAGRDVLVLEETDAPGGTLRIYPGDVRDEDGKELAPRALAERLAKAATSAGARIELRHAAFGHYREQGHLLAHGPGGVLRVRAKELVVATGAHEGALALEGGDLPGVIGVRAACALLALGVLPGEHVVIAGEGPWPDALAAALTAHGARVTVSAHVTRARGRPQVSAAELASGAKVACDCIAVAPGTSGAYELAEQGGAHVRFDGASFFVTASDDGATAAPDVRAVGECTGVRSLETALMQGRAAAHAMLARPG